MRNRETILHKLDSIESNLNKLNFAINRGDKPLYDDTLEKLHEQVDQIKTYIESEPITGFELNPNN